MFLYQSFRFVERPAVRGFISYLNPKVGDENIPKKSCIADAVNTKVEKLDELTVELIAVCVEISCSLWTNSISYLPGS